MKEIVYFEICSWICVNERTGVATILDWRADGSEFDACKSPEVASAGTR